MTKEWVKQKKSEHYEKCNKIVAEITDVINSLKDIDEEATQKLMHKFYSALTKALNGGSSLELDNFLMFAGTDFKFAVLNRIDRDETEKAKKHNKELGKQLEKIKKIFDKLPIHELNDEIYLMNHMERYQDSEPREFNGDIVITDPCYIMKKQVRDYASAPRRDDFCTYDEIDEYPDYNGFNSAQYVEEIKKYYEAEEKWEKENPDDWSLCSCGFNMEELGINNYMTRDTIYGDWGCTTFDMDTKKSIGRFCADAGLVSVLYLDEVLKYNPEWMKEYGDSSCATIIKNFKGTIQFIVEQFIGTYDYDSEYGHHRKGDKWVDYELSIEGHGINTETNEPINFKTSQTEL